MPTWIDDVPPPPEPRASSDYSQKSGAYFRSARKAFVEVLPRDSSARLLEIGCGSGATSAYALAEGKCGWCCGVELCEEPAREARAKLPRVIVGNVEQIDLDLPEHSFDILMLSEVLEHLVDPWSVLRRLRTYMKPGAIVLAGSPNVCHYQVILSLLRGKWPREEKGVFDATHLRWFTPASYQAMFESCGYTVDEVGPARPLGFKAHCFDTLSGGWLRHLLHPQVYLKGRC